MKRITRPILLLMMAWISTAAWSDTAAEVERVFAAGDDIDMVEALVALASESRESAATVFDIVARRHPRVVCETVQGAAVRLDDEENFAVAVKQAENRLKDDPPARRTLRRCAEERHTLAFGGHRSCSAGATDCSSSDRIGESPNPASSPGTGGPPSSNPLLRVQLALSLLVIDAGTSAEVECLEVGCDIAVGLEVEPGPLLDPPASPM